MKAVFQPACPNDIDELLQLYRVVYGSTYALPLGTDPVVMAELIKAVDTTWLIAREQGTNRLVASIMAAVDPIGRVAKLQGLVVHPDCRGSGIGDQAVAQLSDTVLAPGMPVDSVYGTARTTATAPQRICLRNGFHALGVFPNLRKAKRHETMVLLVRYREGVLAKRHPTPKVPAQLSRLITAVGDTVGMPVQPEISTEAQSAPLTKSADAEDKVELIDAPQFVLRRFHEKVTDPTLRFYPFHTPNVLITPEHGEYEVYAHLGRSDGYCALIAAEPNAVAITDHLDQLITQLADSGASYLETLVPLDAYDALCVMLAHGFLPAAAYPAMVREGELYRDHVVLARTLQPLDFQGLSIDSAFRPYIDQYIDLWKHRYLDTRGVFR